jgi:hypothetical protein
VIFVFFICSKLPGVYCYFSSPVSSYHASVGGDCSLTQLLLILEI